VSATNEVTFTGVKVKVSATKKSVTLESNVLYPKEKGDVLSPEKLNELFERAISKCLPNVYSVLDLKTADLKIAYPDKLEETYDL
jgi:ribosomal protein L13